MSKKVLSECVQRRLRSACAIAQYDQNLHWVHLGRKFLHADNEYSDLILCCEHMSEGTFSNIAALLVVKTIFFFKFLHPLI